jgi:peptidoglycan hydrolase-like protein with peptidoglycan-binding domain
MQEYLNFISQTYTSIPKLSTDGIYGSGTEAAVKEYQRIFGLTSDGIIGPTTWNSIVTTYNNLKDKVPNPNTGTNYPGVILKEGSRGASVTLMQEYLNFISNTYTSIPKLTVDGIYGYRMANAVRIYQGLFGLSNDGQIGPLTWNSIVNTYDNLKSQKPNTTDTNYPGIILKEGSRGTSVELIQKYLNLISNVYTSIPKLVVDGVYGYKTVSAVRNFQSLFGLPVDGEVGLTTWNKIIEVYNNYTKNYANNNNNYQYSVKKYPNTNLKIGSTGNDVRSIQEYLNSISNQYTSIPKIAVDGTFGSMTKKAVEEYQKLFGLTADGIVGERTWNSIANTYSAIINK